ncbi:hypothetical protein GGI35DRAFT_363389 [Trichoderma velutinum]
MLNCIWSTDFCDFWNEEATGSDKAREFAENITNTLGVLFEEISFREHWRNIRPRGYCSCLSEFMKGATSDPAHDIYHNSASFHSDYQKKDDQAPYTSVPNEEV